jgi:hypothetical protein
MADDPRPPAISATTLGKPNAPAAATEHYGRSMMRAQGLRSTRTASRTATRALSAVHRRLNHAKAVGGAREALSGVAILFPVATAIGYAALHHLYNYFYSFFRLNTAEIGLQRDQILAPAVTFGAYLALTYAVFGLWVWAATSFSTRSTLKGLLIGVGVTFASVSLTIVGEGGWSTAGLFLAFGSLGATVGYMLHSRHPLLLATRKLTKSVRLALVVTIAAVLGPTWLAYAEQNVRKSAADAFRLGYIPATPSFLIDLPVRPVTLWARGNASDPQRLCRSGLAPYAASLLGNVHGGGWIILRPLGDDSRNQEARVVFVSASDYSFTFSPRSNFAEQSPATEHKPWRTPACEQPGNR